ncbi:type II toxin-antitoxin system VapC family toxin [[Limnothrix rosea] IAM M-220]|uniref:type II toxin-antitoxin system VapC family toxin n=1 Tax=[Limnothrix rosea] IAM M-220 TaxID=454133 RepID=UPI000964F129|nr:PIN domain-containing protein [[Limnothrix rosea] IAM M-220]OKH18166.1 hypothetical protein NIES208_06475 [[Limnothrix rosea] IAM M-220]
MKVLFDTNVILDFFMKRQPFNENAKILFDAIANDKIEAFVSATSVKDIYSLMSVKTKDKEGALEAVKELLKIMTICDVNKRTLEKAIELGYKDFEDAIQVAAAAPVDLQLIVTRNLKDFKNSPIPAVTPEILIAQI